MKMYKIRYCYNFNDVDGLGKEFLNVKFASDIVETDDIEQFIKANYRNRIRKNIGKYAISDDEFANRKCFVEAFEISDNEIYDLFRLDELTGVITFYHTTRSVFSLTPIHKFNWKIRA